MLVVIPVHLAVSENDATSPNKKRPTQNEDPSARVGGGFVEKTDPQPRGGLRRPSNGPSTNVQRAPKEGLKWEDPSPPGEDRSSLGSRAPSPIPQGDDSGDGSQRSVRPNKQPSEGNGLPNDYSSGVGTSSGTLGSPSGM